MRIRIAGEKSVIDDLGAEFARDGVQVESVENSIDRTELRLGLLEAAAIIGIVANVATLIKYLIEVAGQLKSDKKSRVEVKSAAAATFIDIDNTSTAENLEKQLAIHETSDRATGPKFDGSKKKG
ncbi:MAG: hypothetical protein H0U72_13650 [Nitrosospira sp.]|nr:hypothetical protein [Nitrosospira sp.]